jgi:abhydrolase domain-containing protein 5
MMATFGWAKNPMNQRIHQVKEAIPLTLIYGSKSWVDHYPAESIQEKRSSSYVKGHVM